MALKHDQRLIEEYVDWKAQRAVNRKADTPEQFLVERAQDQAIDQLEHALSYLSDKKSLDSAGIDRLVAILEGNELDD